MEVAQAPVFLTDLVDMDVADDTGVVWALRAGADVDARPGRGGARDDPHEPEDAASVRVSAEARAGDADAHKPRLRADEDGDRGEPRC
jgi:hypothetical protein